MIISSIKELAIGEVIKTGILEITKNGSSEIFNMKDNPFVVIREATREEFREFTLANYGMDVKQDGRYVDLKFKYYEITND